jgi:hypothetical protein
LSGRRLSRAGRTGERGGRGRAAHRLQVYLTYDRSTIGEVQGRQRLLHGCFLSCSAVDAQEATPTYCGIRVIAPERKVESARSPSPDRSVRARPTAARATASSKLDYLRNAGVAGSNPASGTTVFMVLAPGKRSFLMIGAVCISAARRMGQIGRRSGCARSRIDQARAVFSALSNASAVASPKAVFTVRLMN